MALYGLPRAVSNIDLRWWYLRLSYPLAEEVQRRTIAGVDAEFHVDTFRQYQRIRDLTREDEIIEDLLSQTEPGDVFYDIGANIGTHSCFAGQVADSVVAFEPHPPTASRLRRNLNLNGVAASVYEYALSDHTGTAVLSLPADSTAEVGTGQFSLRSVDDPQQSYEIDVVGGDELVAAENLPAPDVAKIDVEGAEMEVIDGLRETLTECRTLYCEVHHEHVALDAITDRLEDIGFTCDTSLTRDTTHTFVRARADDD